MIRVYLRGRIDGAVKVPAKELAIRVALRGGIVGAVEVPAKKHETPVAPKSPNDDVVERFLQRSSRYM